MHSIQRVLPSVLCLLFIAAPTRATDSKATVIALRGERGSAHNRELLKQRNTISRVVRPHPETVVFVGDRVIPHFIDGGTWQTAITVVNLENYATSFDIFFFTDSGTDFYVPIEGYGLVRAMHIAQIGR